MNFLYFVLHFPINKYAKFGKFYRATEVKRSVPLDKNHFFHFHPSKRNCSRLKGTCQQLADTGHYHQNGRGLFIDIALVLARLFQPETILFQWMKIETTQLLFVQSMLNRSFDLSGGIKLAKIRLFYYSKLEPKINKIYRNLYISGKARVWELTRCVYFRNTANTSKIMSWFSDMCFSLIYLISYDILIAFSAVICHGTDFRSVFHPQALHVCHFRSLLWFSPM